MDVVYRISWIFLASSLHLTLSATVAKRTEFTAAVYEHAIYLPNITDEPLTREEALKEMKPNVDVFRHVAREAALNVSPVKHSFFLKIRAVFAYYFLYEW